MIFICLILLSFVILVDVSWWLFVWVHCIALHCISFRSVSFRFDAFHFILFCFVSFHFIDFHLVSFQSFQCSSLHFIAFHCISLTDSLFIWLLANQKDYWIWIISWCNGSTKIFQIFSSNSNFDKINIIWYISLLIIIHFIRCLLTYHEKIKIKVWLLTDQILNWIKHFMIINEKWWIIMISWTKIKRSMHNYPIICWYSELLNWFINIVTS
jgi:hypothetical protein